MLVSRGLWLGFQTLVLPVLTLLLLSWVRKKWDESVERREEVKRLLEKVTRETELVENDVVVDYSHSSPSLSSQRFREPVIVMEQLRAGQCAVCISPTTSRCSRCKSVHYCSGKCQIIHWRSGHKDECLSSSKLMFSPKDNPFDRRPPHFAKNGAVHPSSSPESLPANVASELRDDVDDRMASSLAPKRSSFPPGKTPKDRNLKAQVFPSDKHFDEHSPIAEFGKREARSKNSRSLSFDFSGDHPHDYLKNSKRSQANKTQQLKPSKTCNSKIIFPYDIFVELYSYCDELYPFGLINCGNSCYANAVLQCLAFTPPLTAYLMRGLHSAACRMKEWCFVCELEFLVHRGREGESPLSPIKILSKVEKFGNHLGRGAEEDAHEFLRYAVDTMQSVFLREAGPLGSRVEETTLIGLTFGGFLRSKITCLRCHWDSERLERMMDLIVEVDGSIQTLDDAFAQFTAAEILDGANKYYCNRCKSYVKAIKNLSILEAPNILTVVLKRFQSGNLKKLYKAVRFPEVFNIAQYTKGGGDKSPLYNLYAVVVHRGDVNNTSTGHYLCYVKNACGVWFGINDSAVISVDAERVLLEEAYMLLYARNCPRGPPLMFADACCGGPSSSSKMNEWRFCRMQRGHAIDSSSESSSIFSSDASSCSTASTIDFCKKEENGGWCSPLLHNVVDSESLRKRDTWRPKGR